jgi:hypothetical protein
MIVTVWKGAGARLFLRIENGKLSLKFKAALK